MSNESNPNPAIERLKVFDPDAVEGVLVFRGETSVLIRADRLLKVAEFLRDEMDLSFKYLSDVTAVDYFPNDPRFETIYHLYSIEHNKRLRLKVKLGSDDPTVDSMVPIWPGAQAFECELYDLFGIHFTNHPDLRRLLMPEDWEGYPLRKDYPVQGNITRWQ